MTNFVWSYTPKAPAAPERPGKWIVEAPTQAFFERFEAIDRKVEAGEIWRVRYTYRNAALPKFRARPFLAAYCDESRKEDVRRALVGLGFEPKEWRGSESKPGFYEEEEGLGRDLDRFQVFEQKAKDPEFEQKVRG